MRTAFAIARGGRPGPVVVDVPKDVQNWTGTFLGQGFLHYKGYEARMATLTAARVTEDQGADFFEQLGK